jgi:membrane protein implicated in regulation of membrane protease activity
VYWAWKAPLAHGPQTLLGATGQVIAVDGRRVCLRVRGELWLADVQGAPLAQGEQALVVAVDGLRLTATKRLEAAMPGSMSR